MCKVLGCTVFVNHTHPTSEEVLNNILDIIKLTQAEPLPPEQGEKDV